QIQASPSCGRDKNASFFGIKTADGAKGAGAKRECFLPFRRIKIGCRLAAHVRALRNIADGPGQPVDAEVQVPARSGQGPAAAGPGGTGSARLVQKPAVESL